MTYTTITNLTLLFILFLLICQHVLSYLLTLEAFVLITLLTLSSLRATQSGGLVMTLIILAYSTSTAALGLTLLTNLCRSHGKDLFLHFSLT